MLKPTLFAVPLFALLIAAEAFLTARHDREHFDRKDIWTNIAVGLLSLVFGGVLAIFNTFFYQTVYEFSPLKMDMSVWWTWIVLLFADDLAYYWFHRISHESRFFWNFHVVHHSSNQYNLSVAVRQSWFSGVAHWIFYLPIAALGVPLWAWATMHGFNLIYQFWIHTKFVKNIGWLENILNTPSHHRVHHGVNDQYLDKNYGGIFIFWDRLFGTFIKEKEEPRYGIIKPLDNRNLLWINTHAWFETFAAMRGKRTWRGKIRCLFGAPAMDFKEESAAPKAS